MLRSAFTASLFLALLLSAPGASTLALGSPQAVPKQAVPGQQNDPPASAMLSTPVGEASPPGLGAVDVFQQFRLPPFKDKQDGPLGPSLSKLQVAIRALAIGITPNSAVEAWRKAEPLLEQARVAAQASSPQDATTFTGSKASQLNAVLRDGKTRAVRVTSHILQIDEPIVLRRGDILLDLRQARLQVSGQIPTYLLRVENAQQVTIIGGVFEGGASGMLISGSRRITVSHSRFADLSGVGVAITHSQQVVFWSNHLTRLKGSPILLHGDSSQTVISGNQISHNTGGGNWQAGVVVSDRNADVAADPYSLLLANRVDIQEQPIPTRMKIPRNNVIAHNHIVANHSSGIYSDGGVQNVIVANTIEGNAKEGICLDNGSAANVLANNIVRQNGKRWGKSDADLKRDFILQFGRLPDGTSPAKVPGISVDNAMYNVIYANTVDRNHGGGIKMVRTAYFNALGLNTLTSNNEGQSERFHFFGIELGSATADEPVTDLDFTASRGNIVFSNLIQGSHYAGIFFAAGSDTNDVFDNVILGAKQWALESINPETNSSLNNLTNLPSRNMGDGLNRKPVP